MSYARFGSDSNVYVYEHVNGGIECCSCWFKAPGEMCPIFQTSGETILHLIKHLNVGLAVPESAFVAILKEHPNTDEVIK